MEVLSVRSSVCLFNISGESLIKLSLNLSLLVVILYCCEHSGNKRHDRQLLHEMHSSHFEFPVVAGNVNKVHFTSS